MGTNEIIFIVKNNTSFLVFTTKILWYMYNVCAHENLTFHSTFSFHYVFTQHFHTFQTSSETRATYHYGNHAIQLHP